jgi:oligopeptide/dipeptide ABC transporter ATP-binding protein
MSEQPRANTSVSAPLLRVRGVSVTYAAQRSIADLLARRPANGIVALDSVDLDVNAGEIVAVVGESGSGKTTLARVIAGLIDADEGVVEVEGEGPNDWRSVGMVFQDPYETLDPKRTLGEFIAEGLEAQGLPMDRVDTSLEAAELLPAAAFRDRVPEELSGGQRQRVVIAGALALNPKLVIADEPVSMLDVSMRAQILKLIEQLRRDQGIAWLFITHDLSLAWAISDRVVVLYLGAVVEEGTAEQVLRNPAHPYTRALLAALPSTDPGAASTHSLAAGEIPQGDTPSGCRFRNRCAHAVEACANMRPPLGAAPGGGAGHRVACIRAAELPPLS